MPQEGQFNENQAAFFEFLNTHYNKDGGDGALSNLLNDLEEDGGLNDPAGEIPKAAQKIMEEAQAKAAKGEAPVSVKGESVMCIKTWDVDGKKVFFNLGTSVKIDAPELVVRDGEEQTRLPMSLGPSMDDVDGKGEACLVFDVLFNPVTMKDAEVDMQFLNFIVQMIMIRLEEKHADLPAINSSRKFRRLKQKNFKGRQLADQYLMPQPLMRGIDEETGLRDFSGPELAEPCFRVGNVTRKSDGAKVVRLRAELPDVQGDEIELRILEGRCTLLVPGKYKASIPVEVPTGFVVLGSRFHSENYTLTVVSVSYTHLTLPTKRIV
eukprot:TRINITY_DN7264_c0_g1_i10.p1 TRINITY_DN7264_c0_g1~~TRINITY_DN7264_c0_g1_i10.p1  ORF type:complete len:323 (+),score=79.57 TRINITY_DN7264_c0_g1_i10:223-1191(+)